MKDELKGKYAPPTYYACLLNRWHQLSQDHKLTKEYIAKFDEFRIRCSVLGTKSEAQILFRFRDGLRNNLRMELLTRGVTELERAYVLAQDLDAIRSSHDSRSHNQELKKGDLVMVLTAREAVNESDSTIHPKVTL